METTRTPLSLRPGEPARRRSTLSRCRLASSLLAALVFGPGVAAGEIKVTGPKATCAAGRYLVQTSKDARQAVIDFDGSTVQLTGCRPATAARKRTALRATLECASTRARLRFVLSPDCRTLTGEIVAKGLPRRIVGLLSYYCGDGEVDENAGETCEPSLDSSCDPESCTDGGDGLPDGAIAIEAADNAGRITGFSPGHAEVGEEITIQGQNFNRNRAGVPRVSISRPESFLAARPFDTDYGNSVQSQQCSSGTRRSGKPTVVKHGVDFVDALEIFADPLRVERMDKRREYDEERRQVIGMVRGHALFVAYTIRGEVRRLISARRASSHERGAYNAASGRPGR